MRLCFDISQFARFPAASGVQRVLLETAKNCEDDDRFAVIENGRAWILTPARATTIIARAFEGSERPRGLLKEVRRLALGCQLLDSVVDSAGRYVFVEPTYDSEILDAWESGVRRRPGAYGALFHDAAPETHRELFGSPAPSGSSRYFRLMTSLERVVCVSDGSRDQFRELARRTPDSVGVAVLGADHLGRSLSDDEGFFLVVGDLRTKKRTLTTLDAFDRVRGELDHRLVLVGRAVAGERQIEDAVGAAAADRSRRVEWLDGVDDAELAALLPGATATVFVAHGEGFGLPALESLNVGVPLIADRELPALRYADDGGVIALDDVTPETVSEAMMAVACEAEYRRAARQQTLPSWSGFVASMADHLLATDSGERPQ